MNASGEAPGLESPPRPGHARLTVEMVFGESTITSARAASPLKLLTPCSRGKSVWACTSSFGGGLVAGDETRLDVHLGPGARCVIGTQASTKVYRNPNQLPCSHTTSAVVETGALLVFAPEPVQAFADSVYTQRQEFHLAAGAGLVLLDWYSSGRAARGERWAFARFQTRNDVFLAGQRAFIDSTLLDSADDLLSSPHRTGRFNCFALLLFMGPLFQDTARRMLEETASTPTERRAALVCSASPVCEGAVLRAAGESLETVSHELHRHLKRLGDTLGDDPWSRKW